MKYGYVSPEELKKHDPESNENVYLIHDDKNKLLAECYDELSALIIVNSLNGKEQMIETLNTIKEQMIDAGMNANSVLIKIIDKHLQP